MNVDKKNNLIFLSLSLGIFFILGLLPFSIYGQDGYSLWYPIIGEYLHGNSAYHHSEVIFDGQNLASIYGELPFWKLFRLMNVGIETFLNLTHATFVVMLFGVSLTIFKGIKGSVKENDIYILFLYSLLSPVVINRVMAGHLNLLFGLLPFFCFLSLIYSKTVLNVIFCTFAVWCAMSTQAFQVLAYHIFYVPILIYVFLNVEKEKKKYLLLSSFVFVAAFLINLPNFLEMYRHATNPDNLRSIDTNVVYSYLITGPTDLLQLFFSGIYKEILQRNIGFFHEANYALGTFLLIFFFIEDDRKFKILVSVLFIALVLFCSNLPPINYISELPIIKAFRVPQRSLMILALFIPLWTFAKSQFEYKKFDLFIILGITLVAQFLHFFEIIALGLMVGFLFNEKHKSIKIAVFLSFASIFSGAIDKVTPSWDLHSQYKELVSAITPLKEKYDSETLRKRSFYFNTSQPVLINYAAQSLGIRTLEGYGHPPAKFLIKFENITGFKISPLTNNFYFQGLPDKDKVLKEFGVQTIVSFGLNNEIITKDL